MIVKFSPVSLAKIFRERLSVSFEFLALTRCSHAPRASYAPSYARGTTDYAYRCSCFTARETSGFNALEDRRAHLDAELTSTTRARTDSRRAYRRATLFASFARFRDETRARWW